MAAILGTRGGRATRCSGVTICFSQGLLPRPLACHPKVTDSIMVIRSKQAVRLAAPFRATLALTRVIVSSPEDERQAWAGEMAHSVMYLLYKHEDPNLLSTVHIKSQAPATHSIFYGRPLHRLVSVALSFYRDSSMASCEQLQCV